jgi:hypothetical protein
MNEREREIETILMIVEGLPYNSQAGLGGTRISRVFVSGRELRERVKGL